MLIVFGMFAVFRMLIPRIFTTAGTSRRHGGYQVPRPARRRSMRMIDGHGLRRKRRGYRGCAPSVVSTQHTNIAASVIRPGESGNGEKDDAQECPHPQRAVPSAQAPP